MRRNCKALLICLGLFLFFVPSVFGQSFIEKGAKDRSGLKNDYTAAAVNKTSNAPAPIVTATDIKATDKKITAVGKEFIGTTLLVDGIGFFAKDAVINSANTKLTQEGRLANGRLIRYAVPRGKTVILTFRNADGGVTVVPFTRR